MIGSPRPTAVAARLERAQRHVDELERLLGAYVERPPYRLTTRTAEGGRIERRASLSEDPPGEAAMLVSDAIHQARAALDNLANALRPDGPSERVFFPIRATESAYAEALARGALNGLPAWAVEAIAAVQSWSTDDRRWAGRELENLHELARIDRHRVPPIHAAVVLPDSAWGDDLAAATPAIDPRGRWATWTFDPATTHGVAFAVEVLFGAEANQPADVEVADWTAYLVRMTGEAVDMVLRSARAEKVT